MKLSIPFLQKIKSLGQRSAPSNGKEYASDCMTIVIPSKGRPKELRKLLNYFNESGVRYPVLILLSGDEGMYSPEQFPKLTITFRQFDSDMLFYKKLSEGLDTVTTPLVAMCADDDIVLHNALVQCSEFLMKNPDYSAAQGYHATFSESDDVVNLVNIAYFTPSIENHDPLLRLNELIRRYQPICWAVFRTQTMIAITRTFDINNNFIFNELLWSSVATIAGKIKRLPIIFCLRRIDRMHFSGHPLFAMMESPQRFFLEYTSYRNLLSDMLAAQSRLSRQQIERAVDLIHACYFGRETVPSTLNFFTDNVLADPKTSITDEHIDRALRPVAANLGSGWAQEISQGKWKYRIFPGFASPEPKEEIHLSGDYSQDIIKDLARYYTTSS